jgi:hypothetical protein
MIAVTSPGSIRVETALSLVETCRFLEKHGLTTAFAHFGGSLVDKARNDACRSMLQNGHGWVLFIDGDMQFAPDAAFKIVQTAYHSHPWADIVGGYCVLRGGAVPTIDTGTGTWESHYPGSGVMEVMRTGAAFLLIKRHVIERLPQPWFACRHPQRWLDSFLEVDNLARTMYDGANPFQHLPGDPWGTLLQKAASDSQSAKPATDYEIGEDSGFCDLAKSKGFRIVVDSGIEIGHVDTVVLNGATHKERMDIRERESRLQHGVLT